MNNPYGLHCCKCSSPLTSYCELSGWSLIEYIIFCHTLWWIFYFFLIIVTKQSAEWCCRLLTFFHGCLISYCALRDAYINKSRIDFKRTPLSGSKKHYLSYMFSYFLFDFCWIHFFGNETKIIYFHHIASILIIFNMLLRNIGSPGIDYGAAGLELTNPYLQLRWFLRSHGQQDTTAHKVVELWFLILFSLIRVFGGTILVYHAVLKSDMDYLTKLTFIFIYGISMVLQLQIVAYFRKKYLNPGNRVLLISSRVSISLYFQRRTLDRYENRYDESQGKNLASEELTSNKNLTAKKESTTSKESSIRRKSSGRRESSARRESFARRESSASRESSARRKSYTRKESFASEEPAASLPPTGEEPAASLPSTGEEPAASLPPTDEEPAASLPSASEQTENLKTENLEETINPENDTEKNE